MNDSVRSRSYDVADDNRSGYVPGSDVAGNIFRQVEEAEIAEVTRFASDGNDVGESEKDDKNSKEKHSHQNVSK